MPQGSRLALPTHRMMRRGGLKHLKAESCGARGDRRGHTRARGGAAREVLMLTIIK